MGDIRKRNWRLIFYPESLPDNWIEQLRDYHIPFIVSPLHDKDLDGQGNPKKSHYHIILTFDGNKSFTQIKEITDAFNQPIPQPCDHIRGAVRYLIHIDDADKYLYAFDDIRSYNGATYQEYFGCSQFERSKILSNIFDIIEVQNIKSYRQLIMYIKDNIDDFDYLDIALHSTFAIRTYLFDKRDDI